MNELMLFLQSLGIGLGELAKLAPVIVPIVEVVFGIKAVNALGDAFKEATASNDRKKFEDLVKQAEKISKTEDENNERDPFNRAKAEEEKRRARYRNDEDKWDNTGINAEINNGWSYGMGKGEDGIKEAKDFKPYLQDADPRNLVENDWRRINDERKGELDLLAQKLLGDSKTFTGRSPAQTDAYARLADAFNAQTYLDIGTWKRATDRFGPGPGEAKIEKNPAQLNTQDQKQMDKLREMQGKLGDKRLQDDTEWLKKLRDAKMDEAQKRQDQYYKEAFFPADFKMDALKQQYKNWLQKDLYEYQQRLTQLDIPSKEANTMLAQIKSGNYQMYMMYATAKKMPVMSPEQFLRGAMSGPIMWAVNNNELSYFDGMKIMSELEAGQTIQAFRAMYDMLGKSTNPIALAIRSMMDQLAKAGYEGMDMILQVLPSALSKFFKADEQSRSIAEATKKYYERGGAEYDSMYDPSATYDYSWLTER